MKFKDIPHQSAYSYRLLMTCAWILIAAVAPFLGQPVRAEVALGPVQSQSSIKGQVTDAAGKPLASVTIVYLDSQNKSSKVTTDSKGLYAFPAAPGRYLILPRLNTYGFAPSQRVVTVTLGTVQNANFVGYHEAYILGRVTTSEGQAVPGVTVKKIGRNGPADTTVTDAEGYYGFADVPLGRYGITLTKPSYSFISPSATVTLGAHDNGVNLNFLALQGTSLSGRITKSDGTPVPSVGVLLTNSSGQLRRTLTNAEGYYGFSSVVADDYTLLARGPTYNLLPPLRHITTDGRTSLTQNDFTALETPFISGRITTSASVGIAGVQVVLRQETSSTASTVTASTTTDNQGYYGFSHVAAGTYLIIPQLAHYTLQPPLTSVTISTTGANPRLTYPNINFVAASTAPPAPSTVVLSTAQAQVSTGSVHLHFTGALNAETASEPAYFTVTINGQSVAVQSAAYASTTHTVTLILAPDALKAGMSVLVQWDNLADANGLPIKPQSVVLTAH